jgi:CRP-like cAMP-binding protein
MISHQLPSPLDRLQEKDQVLRTIQGGDVLFVQNSATVGLYYLISGTIHLKRSSSGGHSVIIHRAHEGDTFAEASIFSDTYHCTATAAVESRLIECSRSAIETLFNSDLNFAKNMASRFARQMQQCRRRVELLSIRAADERILEAIVDGLLVENIASFAETIALAPETVYRNLANLTREGKIVKTARGRYRLSTDDVL